jgi:hypothetical protein
MDNDGIFYGHLVCLMVVHFMAKWYIFFSFWYVVQRKNLATLEANCQERFF